MELRQSVRARLRDLGVAVHRQDVNHSLDDFLAWLLPELGVDHVIDVGGHHGEYGRRVRAAGYAGPITSFEPAGPSRAVLEQVAADDRTWHVLPWGLGDVDEDAVLNLSDESDMNSLLTPTERGRVDFDADMTATEQIVVRRLDGMFDAVVRQARRVYLKIDTQGYDIHVFRGASGVLDRIVAMQTELSLLPLYEEQPHYTSVLDELADGGFTPSGMFLVARDPGHRLVELDAVLVRS